MLLEAMALAAVARDCVLKEAVRLEPSNEAADIVATAALSKCDKELAAIRHSARYGAKLEVEMRKRLREAAIGEVVTRRAR